MGEDSEKLQKINKLKKDLKPKLFWPIWNTIICSGPPLNLIFRYYLERDMKNPTAGIILTVIAMIWMVINWYWYVKERKDFKKNWEEILIELQDLDLQEDAPKDNMDTILHILEITAIASLVMFFIFAAITLLTKLSFFKYLMFLSILIFLISAIGLIIGSVIMIFSFLREVGSLKKVVEDSSDERESK